MILFGKLIRVWKKYLNEKIKKAIILAFLMKLRARALA